MVGTCARIFSCSGHIGILVISQMPYLPRHSDFIPEFMAVKNTDGVLGLKCYGARLSRGYGTSEANG